MSTAGMMKGMDWRTPKGLVLAVALMLVPLGLVIEAVAWLLPGGFTASP